MPLFLLLPCTSRSPLPPPSGQAAKMRRSIFRRELKGGFGGGGGGCLGLPPPPLSFPFSTAANTLPPFFSVCRRKKRRRRRGGGSSFPSASALHIILLFCAHVRFGSADLFANPSPPTPALQLFFLKFPLPVTAEAFFLPATGIFSVRVYSISGATVRQRGLPSPTRLE